MISVCMATFNGARYLKPQIESILSQLGPDDRLIISDGGSTDHTLKIINSFSDSRITLVIYESSSDSSSTDSIRNNFLNALRHASGEIFFFADQDDVWLPGKIADTAALLKEISNDDKSTPVVVHTDLRVVDENLNIIHDSFWRATGRFPELALRKGFLYVFPIITGCTAAFNSAMRRLLLQAPPVNCLHDELMGILICHHNGKIAFLDRPSILYRQHGKNMVGARQPSLFARALMFVSRARNWYVNLHTLTGISLPAYIRYKLQFSLLRIFHKKRLSK